MLVAFVPKRSTSRVVYFSIEVKSWAAQPPPVGAVRPARCPACGAPGAPVAGPVGLHGHGLRERSVLGPAVAGAAPVSETLQLRRYQCQRCDAVVVAAPRGLLSRLRYGAVAVALALALWSSQRQPGWRVHGQVSPRPSAGNEPMHGWRSLSRWARRSSRWWPLRAGPPGGGARESALELVRQLAARAPMPTGRLYIDACAGALHTVPIGAAPAGRPFPPPQAVAM